jgi:hypothetical protein
LLRRYGRIARKKKTLIENTLIACVIISLGILSTILF